MSHVVSPGETHIECTLSAMTNVMILSKSSLGRRGRALTVGEGIVGSMGLRELADLEGSEGCNGGLNEDALEDHAPLFPGRGGRWSIIVLCTVKIQLERYYTPHRNRNELRIEKNT